MVPKLQFEIVFFPWYEVSTLSVQVRTASNVQKLVRSNNPLESPEIDGRVKIEAALAEATLSPTSMGYLTK